MTVPTDTEKLAQALRTIQYSMQQAQIPGNDSRREIKLTANICEQALAAHELRAQPHDLIKTGDPDATPAICDANGDVVLAYCRRCKQGEGDLEETCPGARAQPAIKCACCGDTGRAPTGSGVTVECPHCQSAQPASVVGGQKPVVYCERIDGVGTFLGGKQFAHLAKVYGHPRLGDIPWARTSPIVSIETENTIYVIGKAAAPQPAKPHCHECRDTGWLPGAYGGPCWHCARGKEARAALAPQPPAKENE